MHVSAHSYSQTVSFSGKNVPLQAVFASIEKQTGLSFFFNYALIRGAKPVTLDIKEVTLENALHEVLKDQGLDFYKTGKTIFIVKKATEVTSKMHRTEIFDAKEVDVKGKVTNQQGEALIGATVTLKNGKKGTQTDEKGMFWLKNIPTGSMLEVSYSGYQRKEILIDADDAMTIQLIVSDNKLDEIQVIAYGSTTQRLSTGNVSTVKAEEIEKQSVSNPLLALEGRVPGLFITQAGGVPGSGVSILIQGQNSILKGNDPFYVVDGVPFVSQLLPNLGGILRASTVNNFNAQNGNPFSFINPSDIESISILKDADATAIYGSRAANGAILITTKKGKIGQSKVNFNLQRGWGGVTRKMDLFDLPQYLQMRHEALKNDRITTPSATDYDINGLWDTTRHTDWQKLLIGRTCQYSNFYGSISGGTSNLQYIVGGTYHKETTVFPGNFSDQKGAIHFNLNSVSAKQKLKFQFSGNYLIDNDQLPNQDMTNMALYLAPDAPPLYNVEGSLNWALNPSGNSSWTNPLSYLYNVYQNKTTNLVSNAVLSYLILPGLEVKGSFGYTSLQSNEITTLQLSYLAPEFRVNSTRSAKYGYNTLNSWIIEPQLNYKWSLGKGRLEALAGTTIQQNNSNGLQLTGSGYNSDAVLQDIHSAAAVAVTSTINNQYKYNAAFGRINYNWQEKYVINLTARRDGSSRFGQANEFHNFGAIGGAWVFSNEPVIKNAIHVLSFGKLRASYGTTGNDQIGDYQFLNLYSTSYSPVPYQGITGLQPTALSNPYLQWEETRKLQFGIDAEFLKDRVLVTANYFHNRSSNELLSYALPIVTGFTSITRNFPAKVQNTGFEFTLSTVNLKVKNFTWLTNFNITIPKNKLIAFQNLSTSSYASTLIIGQPISVIETYHFLGVDAATGVYKFADLHGNATSTPSALSDKTMPINISPIYYGGLENSFHYGDFQLDILFQFIKRKGANYVFGSYPGAENSNQPISIINRWKRAGDVTSIQRYNSTGNLFAQDDYASASDAGYSDASYIRLKNVSLSWQMPNKWNKKIESKNIRIYLQGQNLLTFTHYKGLDPETLNSTRLPPLRILVAGIQADF
jgi:TonB-linked SusC/RagA family outer membrane protein